MDDAIASPDRILPADMTASGFYISNTWNRVQGNAASGKSHTPINWCFTPHCTIKGSAFFK